MLSLLMMMCFWGDDGALIVPLNLNVSIEGKRTVVNKFELYLVPYDADEHKDKNPSMANPNVPFDRDLFLKRKYKKKVMSSIKFKKKQKKSFEQSFEMEARHGAGPYHAYVMMQVTDYGVSVERWTTIVKRWSYRIEELMLKDGSVVTLNARIQKSSTHGGVEVLWQVLAK